MVYKQPLNQAAVDQEMLHWLPVDCFFGYLPSAACISCTFRTRKSV